MTTTHKTQTKLKLRTTQAAACEHHDMDSCSATGQVRVGESEYLGCEICATSGASLLPLPSVGAWLQPKAWLQLKAKRRRRRLEFFSIINLLTTGTIVSHRPSVVACKDIQTRTQSQSPPIPSVGLTTVGRFSWSHQAAPCRLA